MRLLAVTVIVQLVTLVSQDFVQPPTTPLTEYFDSIPSHTGAFQKKSVTSTDQLTQSASIVFSMAESIAEAIKRLDRQLVDEEDGLERIKEYAEAANETAEKAQELAEQTNDVVRRNRKLIAQRRKQLQELRGLGASSDTARQKGLLKPLDLESVDSGEYRLRHAGSLASASFTTYPSIRVPAAERPTLGPSREPETRVAEPAQENKHVEESAEEDAEQDAEEDEEEDAGEDKEDLPDTRRRRRPSLSTHSEIVVARRPSAAVNAAKEQNNAPRAAEKPAKQSRNSTTKPLSESSLRILNQDQNYPQRAGTGATTSENNGEDSESAQNQPRPAGSFVTSSSGLFIPEQYVPISDPGVPSGDEQGAHARRTDVEAPGFIESGERHPPLQLARSDLPSTSREPAPEPQDAEAASVSLSIDRHSENGSLMSSLFGEREAAWPSAEESASRQHQQQPGEDETSHRRSKSSSDLFVSDDSPALLAGLNSLNPAKKRPAPDGDREGISSKRGEGGGTKSQRKEPSRAELNSMVSDALLQKYKQ